MDDAYSVQTTAADTSEADGLERLMALKDADTLPGGRRLGGSEGRRRRPVRP